MMDEKSWHKIVLEKMPHGEEGTIELNWDDAVTWAKILNRIGYAVLLTGGEFEGEVTVRWLYAGDTDNLSYADYGKVVFSSVDVFEDYPEAYNSEYGDEEDFPTKPEVSE